MKNPNEMNNLNYYFGGNRGIDTLMLLMDYPGDSHGRPEVRSFVKRMEKLIHGKLEDYEKWCNSTERPSNECWHDGNIRYGR